MTAAFSLRRRADEFEALLSRGPDAALDERVNAGIPAFEAALKANAKHYTIYMYPGVNHAFNNDTNAARYNKEAADLAWSRSISFFKERLGTPRAG